MSTRRRYIDPDVEDEIIRLTQEGKGPSQIHRSLLANAGHFSENIPHERTIQRIVRETRPDPSGKWEIRYSEPEDARVILDTMMHLVMFTNGGIRELTRHQAEWIARIRRIAPTIPPHDSFRLAWFYAARESQKESTNDLDAFLMFQAWTPAGRSAYEKALAEGLYQRVPGIKVTEVVDGQRVIEPLTRESYNDALSRRENHNQ